MIDPHMNLYFCLLRVIGNFIAQADIINTQKMQSEGYLNHIKVYHLGIKENQCLLKQRKNFQCAALETNIIWERDIALQQRKNCRMLYQNVDGGIMELEVFSKNKDLMVMSGKLVALGGNNVSNSNVKLISKD